MRNLENVVDFADICMFAESEKMAFYNAAVELLQREFYPDAGSPLQLYRCEVDQYTDDPKAIEILQGFMDHNQVEFINITA